MSSSDSQTEEIYLDVFVRGSLNEWGTLVMNLRRRKDHGTNSLLGSNRLILFQSTGTPLAADLSLSLHGNTTYPKLIQLVFRPEHLYHAWVGPRFHQHIISHCICYTFKVA